MACDTLFSSSAPNAVGVSKEEGVLLWWDCWQLPESQCKRRRPELGLEHGEHRPQTESKTKLAVLLQGCRMQVYEVLKEGGSTPPSPR